MKASSPTPSELAELRILEREELQVTEGEVERSAKGMLRVESAKMRAVAPAVRGETAELRFTYLGPTAKQEALSSGQMRRQIGLKLRAQDGCNLLYAMWRFAPVPELVVSTKINPGMHRSSECGAGGYKNIKPRKAIALSAPQPGESHVLRAHLDGAEMRVYVDGTLAWEGTLGPEAFSFDGPVGVRSDDGRFEFQLRAGQSSR